MVLQLCEYLLMEEIGLPGKFSHPDCIRTMIFGKEQIWVEAKGLVVDNYSPNYRLTNSLLQIENVIITPKCLRGPG
ncbi:MAG: hypothetical protein EA411_07310 [Saprospirales bacterium]|nr:MAG: hypothetical protein EA411_07310 [Saprospirales bacterium]